jgi:hypothetical protein
MKKLLCGCALLLGAWSKALAQQAPPEKPAPLRAEVLMLGVYHMANPGKDIVFRLRTLAEFAK